MIGKKIDFQPPIRQNMFLPFRSLQMQQIADLERKAHLEERDKGWKSSLTILAV